jgi:hypothetical protein
MPPPPTSPSSGLRERLRKATTTVQTHISEGKELSDPLVLDYMKCTMETAIVTGVPEACPLVKFSATSTQQKTRLMELTTRVERLQGRQKRPGRLLRSLSQTRKSSEMEGVEDVEKSHSEYKSSRNNSPDKT